MAFTRQRVESPPEKYLAELIAVGDARYKLGQYDKAGNIFYRAYYMTMHSDSVMNAQNTFPFAHKMLQAWKKSKEEHILKMAHGMAEQTCMMPGCPAYIRQDKSDLETAMKKKGMEVESILNALT